MMNTPLFPTKAKEMVDVKTPQPTQLTLGEVLSQPSLGLSLLTPKANSLNRPVTGAHSFEISNPTRWISSHWIALTTGLRLKGKPEEQRELIEELVDGGITALGFALGINFKSVPSSILEVANELDLPVFSVPFATGFAEIIAFVNQALLSPNVGALRRFVSVQDYLLDSLLSQKPLRSLVERLSPLVLSQVALISSSGELVASSDNLELNALAEINQQLGLTTKGPRQLRDPKVVSRSRLGDTPATTLSQLIEFDTPYGPGLALAVVTPTQETMWLALIKTNESKVEPGFHLSLPLIRSAGHILSIALSTNAEKLNERRSSERALLAELVGIRPVKGATHKGYRTHFERLIEIGIDFSEPVHVIVGSPSSETSRDLKESIGEQIDALTENFTPTIWDSHNSKYVAIIQAKADVIEKILNEISTPPNLNFGISKAVDGPGQFSLAYRQANAAYGELIEKSARSDARKGSQGTGVLWFDDCNMVTWLITQADKTSFACKQKDRLAIFELERHSLATLKAYLDSNLDINLAATNLGIHPNSMRYRLNKVHEAVGVDLDCFGELVDLYVALKVIP
ncbi:purine catabolism regulatory protein [Acidithrix ferrooxidans]|uniref:Purine catabolism regulatory protein n=2 Tax=Acidithrix ferrooxidans TaxID=1280514 RepID=A0A0D8HGC4_9ACTN|nr:purine catabolism regulatory protein [Acidithrix ferrooxidans]